MADQTYLQHAQPSTFGHYLLSFAFPVLRGGQRLSEALEWTDASPGGAGCVNGSRLLPDRTQVASLLGFRSVAEHTRDAMWQVDGLFDMVERSADRDAAVQVSFDPRWHSLTYVYTRALPGPDMWAIIEARGFRPF